MPLKNFRLDGRATRLRNRGDAAAQSSPDRTDLEALFLSNLDAIERAIRFVCQRHKMTATDAEEFASEVKLKLVDKNYEVLRKFEGRSSLQTFVTVVVHRMLLDFQNHRWGKWRPSAEARRLGEVAIRLERLMVRDGLGIGEACGHLKMNENLPVADSELVEIASRLPARVRRTIVGEEVLERTPSNASAEHSALLTERRAAARRILEALRIALQELGDQDRLILRLRFQQGFSVADIARALHLDDRPLYRRMETLFRQLRKALRESGIPDAEAQDVLNGGVDMDLALLGGTSTFWAVDDGETDEGQ